MEILTNRHSLTDEELVGLHLSPPSSGRAICQRTIARFFWLFAGENGLNIPYWPAYKTALFFLLSKLKLHVTGNEAPAWYIYILVYIYSDAIRYREIR